MGWNKWVCVKCFKMTYCCFRGLRSRRFLGWGSVIFGSHCLLIHTSHEISKHVHPSFLFLFFFFLQLSLRPVERNNILCWLVSFRGENEHFFFFLLKKQTNLFPKIANYSLQIMSYQVRWVLESDGAVHLDSVTSVQHPLVGIRPGWESCLPP